MASLLLISACGGGDSDDGLKALADAIELEIENDEEADFLSGKGACIADKAIAYGAENLPRFHDNSMVKAHVLIEIVSLVLSS